jgi:hypothetical protein
MPTNQNDFSLLDYTLFCPRLPRMTKGTSFLDHGLCVKKWLHERYEVVTHVHLFYLAAE